MNDFRPSGFQILPMVVKNLLIINGLVFLAMMALNNAYGFDLTEYLGLHYFTSQYFRPYQLVTHMFMHANFIHIFSNMFALWMFGSVIENVWGPKRFLIFYFVCGLGGALCHLAVTGYEIHHVQNEVNAYILAPGLPKFITLLESNHLSLTNFIAAWKEYPSNPDFVQQSIVYAKSIVSMQADIPVVGASGAVFGVLLAFGMMFPNTYLYIYFFVPMKAKYFVAIYMLFELYAGFTGTESGVAHFAHLGGALFGYLMIRYWNKTRRHDFF